MDHDAFDALTSFEMQPFGDVFMGETLPDGADISQATPVGAPCVDLYSNTSSQNTLPQTPQQEMMEACSPADEARQLELAVILHPLYPKLLDAITSCRKIGLSEDSELRRLDERCRQTKIAAAASRNAAIATGGLPSQVDDADLREYLEQYIAIAEEHRNQLASLYSNVDSASRALDAEIADMLSGKAAAATGSNGHCSGVSAASDTCSGSSTSRGYDSCASAESSETLKKVLKRKYADQVNALQEEFSRKRKHAKLPDDACAVLRDWFNQHFTWPYPTDEDKAWLEQASGLQATQVNNWFINQRKRHWLKLFAGQQPPANAEQAELLLWQAGLQTFQLPMY